MNLENSNNPLSACKLRIIAVTMSPDSANNCVYRVYTSDGGFSQYVGFDSVPAFCPQVDARAQCMGIYYSLLHVHFWGEGDLNGLKVVIRASVTQKVKNSLEALNLTIEDLEKSIMDVGGGFAYILHDKEDCQTHYHIACMWEKSVMPWDDTDKQARLFELDEIPCMCSSC